MHATICDQLYDLVQNALEAGATVVDVAWTETRSKLSVCVQDNGGGMTPAVRARALDPFYTDGRKHARQVGLGLPFLRQMVETTGGQWSLESDEGVGTTVWFAIDRSHVDAPPTGNLTRTVAGLMVFEGEHELIVRREGEPGQYQVRRSELRDVLGDLSLASSQALLEEYIASQEEVFKMRKGTGYGSHDA